MRKYENRGIIWRLLSCLEDILKNTGEKDTKLINKLNTEIHEGLYLVIYGTKEEPEVKVEKNNIDEFIQNYEKKTRTRKKKEND